MIHLVAIGIWATIFFLWTLMLALGLRISRPLFRVPYFLLILFGVVTWVTRNESVTLHDIDPLLMPPLFHWPLVLTFCLAIVTIYASRRRKSELHPRAARWSPFRLLALTMACLGVTSAAIYFETLEARKKWAHWRDEGNRAILDSSDVAGTSDGKVNAARLYIAAFDVGLRKQYESDTDGKIESIKDFVFRDAAPFDEEDERAFHLLSRASRLDTCRFDPSRKPRPTSYDVAYAASLMYRYSVLSDLPESQWVGVQILHRLADHLTSRTHCAPAMTYTVERKSLRLAQWIILCRPETAAAIDSEHLAGDVNYSENVPATIASWNRDLLLRTSQAWLGELQPYPGRDQNRYHDGVNQCGPDFTSGLRLDLIAFAVQMIRSRD